MFYAIATVFQLYLGGVMYEMRKKGENPSLQGIFNLPLYIDMVWEELAFDDAVSCTQWEWIAYS